MSNEKLRGKFYSPLNYNIRTEEERVSFGNSSKSSLNCNNIFAFVLKSRNCGEKLKCATWKLIPARADVKIARFHIGFETTIAPLAKTRQILK